MKTKDLDGIDYEIIQYKLSFMLKNVNYITKDERLIIGNLWKKMIEKERREIIQENEALDQLNDISNTIVLAIYRNTLNNLINF